jgi:NAD+ dependent glucose-6-phosphate dehydrogenase
VKILITGMSGLIGSLLYTELYPRHEVQALCRSVLPNVDQVNESITDYEAILPAFRDVEVVVHLVAFRADDPTTELIQTNIEGTHNIFKAAVDSGVRRVVFASSGGVVRGYLSENRFIGSDGAFTQFPLDGETSPWPVRPYDATKAADESIARVFAENTGIDAICVRIGKCLKDDVPVDRLVRPLWVSQRDITQLIARCVEQQGPLWFKLVYWMSANTPPAVDLSRASSVFGYSPQDGCTWSPTTAIGPDVGSVYG